jgi:hypothetical protein
MKLIIHLLREQLIPIYTGAVNSIPVIWDDILGVGSQRFFCKYHPFRIRGAQRWFFIANSFRYATKWSCLIFFLDQILQDYTRSLYMRSCHRYGCMSTFWPTSTVIMDFLFTDTFDSLVNSVHTCVLIKPSMKSNYFNNCWSPYSCAIFMRNVF